MHIHSTNQTIVAYFLIKGISDVPKLQSPIFFLVLLIYIIALGGNFIILLLVCLEPNLHTPMYFFLGNLSILDISSTTTTLHIVIISYLFGVKTISFFCCITQCYIFTSLTGSELFILTAMSYDRYVAICNPLHYHLVMNFSTCALLASACWLCGFIEIIPHFIILSKTACFLSIEINHFFCDLIPLQKLICSNNFFFDITISICSMFLATFPPILTFIPYVFIIITILKIKSSTGRRKGFYTCSSHLTVVVLLYVTLIFQYLRPTSEKSLEANKLFALFNTAAVPMLNPIIYSLKNKAVKSALRRRIR